MAVPQVALAWLTPTSMDPRWAHLINLLYPRWAHFSIGKLHKVRDNKLTNKIEVKLRLKKEEAEKLKRQAEKERRSVNNLLEKIIAEYIEKQENN